MGMAMSGARTRLRDLQVDWGRLVLLAGATLVLAFGVFCTWQTWLIADQGSAVRQVHVAQDQAVQALAAEIAQERRDVAKAIDNVDPGGLPANVAQVQATLKQRLSQAVN